LLVILTGNLPDTGGDSVFVCIDYYISYFAVQWIASDKQLLKALFQDAIHNYLVDSHVFMHDDVAKSGHFVHRADEIGRNRKVDLGIVADVKETLKGLLERGRAWSWSHHAWGEGVKRQCQALEANMLGGLGEKADPIHPVHLMKEINAFLDKDAVLVADGGDTQVWTGMCREANLPGHYLESGVFGCLGVGIPFALAAKLRYPEKQVLVTMGDGSAGLNLMEFDTALRHRLPIVMVIMNDCSWGMIRHLQEAKFKPEQRAGCELGRVAYDKVVEALGGYGETVTRSSELRPALVRAFASGRPACLNVYTDRGAVSPFTVLLYSLGS
jgi:acetolactate synthase-1/2/3 large subunit